MIGYWHYIDVCLSVRLSVCLYEWICTLLRTIVVIFLVHCLICTLLYF